MKEEEEEEEKDNFETKQFYFLLISFQRKYP
jgi:hypothetical protein